MPLAGAIDRPSVASRTVPSQVDRPSTVGGDAPVATPRRSAALSVPVAGSMMNDSADTSAVAGCVTDRPAADEAAADHDAKTLPWSSVSGRARSSPTRQT